ncbi:unnamed protein product [Notodromas monacha]|uniref:Phospholipase A2-like central domain-containing protein n=1 Tax=Notodromas monacha TaxID=399045 RepID=A0A7R9BM92_9CRUS|nr:unnamed protein product [Notodromas monacha]CAG0917201.1 unnamed protein product [Notodromas monacha]
MQIVSHIFAGTVWCGDGNIADGYYDEGELRTLDVCCRAHDFCPDYLYTGIYYPLFNLTNELPFTVNHCDCDQAFQECLQSVNDADSQAVGEILYNLLTQPCFREDYPIVQCLEWGGFLGNVCLQYELDFSGEPFWQIFSNPLYTQSNDTIHGYRWFQSLFP